ncbi:hypothetical protein [Wolbachia endosymbiont of Zygogramma bicolorata]|uniref:hypothetical protein n=1 Tax=Wolbachia endosymbiont of Zygogramma bicolorata TaxID=3134048 RepID=UPI003DA86BDC
MPNISEVNRELVKAFNINLRFNSIAVTNLTVQNLHGKDHIVISFDKNMDSKQCMKYLNNMKEKIIKRSYRDEKAAGVSYNLKFFPFAFNTKHLPRDDKGRKKFSVEIDEGVVFNLKCYLAQALAGSIKVGIGNKFGVRYAKKSIYDASFDRNSYLYCMLFHDKGLQKDFVDLFSAEIEGYPNPPSDYLEEKGNLVYIKKGIFDDIEFIKDIIAYNASLECRYLQTPSAKNNTVDKLKYIMIDFIDRAADIPVRTITRTSYVDKKEDSVLIPLVQNGKFLGFLSKDDAYDLNRTFGDAVVTRIESHRLKNPYWSSDYVYAIDFADVDISYCVLNKIMESSVINKDHELSIDPELVRALSPPGTPPNQRNRDSGIGVSPLTKDSGSSSGGPGPSTELSDMEWGSPTRSQDGALEGSPRQGLVSVLPLNPLDVPGTSGGPLTHLGYSTVSRGVAGPSSSLQSVGAAANMPAWTSASFQPMDRSSLPVFYAQSSDISVPRFQPPTQLSSSGPSSWKGAAKNVQASTSARAQQTNPCLSQCTSGNKWQPLQFTEPGFSGLSWKGANESTSIGNSTWYVSLSGSPDLGILGDYPKGTESICGVEPEKQQVSDECSEAQSQESESPKKHGGGLQSTIKSFLSSLSKPKQHDASLKRCDVGRDTMHSSVSAPGDFVTEKPPLSERSASERRAKSNSPSKETSPVHSTISGSIPGLPSQGTTVVESNSGLKSQKRLDRDQREELRPFLSSEMKEKLDSNSFSPGEEQHLYLTHTPSGKWELSRSLCEGKESQLLRLAEAQLPSSDNLSSQKVNRDSGFCSIGSASPAVPHKGSVSSELKHPQQVKHMSEALGK